MKFGWRVSRTFENEEIAVPNKKKTEFRVWKYLAVNKEISVIQADQRYSAQR
jgi:hypothetical protein